MYQENNRLFVTIHDGTPAIATARNLADQIAISTVTADAPWDRLYAVDEATGALVEAKHHSVSVESHRDDQGYQYAATVTYAIRSAAAPVRDFGAITVLHRDC
jgi:hypothetical protein